MPIQKVSNYTHTESGKNEKINVVIQKKSRITSLVLILIAVFAIAGFGFMFKKYIETKKQLEVATSAQKEVEELVEQQKKVKELLEKVGNLIVLPKDEEPTVATITDVESLKQEQSFYSDAKNGDRVIIYMQAKKAIIYDEENNILVNVGPIFLNEETEAPPVGYEGEVN